MNKLLLISVLLSAVSVCAQERDRTGTPAEFPALKAPSFLTLMPKVDPPPFTDTSPVVPFVSPEPRSEQSDQAARELTMREFYKEKAKELGKQRREEAGIPTWNL